MSYSRHARAVEYNRDRGYSRRLVQEIQRLVGSLPDGAWGQASTIAVARWQKDHGLAPDGRVGPLTLDAMMDAMRRGISSPHPPLDTRRLAAEHPGRRFMIDVSRHQGAIDHALVEHDADIDGVYIKATEGRTHRDPRFSQNWSGFRGRVRRGAYHYAIMARPGVSVLFPLKPQLDNLFRSLDHDQGELPVALDLETSEVGHAVDAAGAEAAASWIITAVEIIESETGRPPMLYWAHRLWSDLDMGQHLEPLKRCPTWWARYHTTYDLSGEAPPDHPDGWGWSLWQFTCDGSVAGIEGDVDVSIVEPSWMRCDCACKSS